MRDRTIEKIVWEKIDSLFEKITDEYALKSSDRPPKEKDRLDKIILELSNVLQKYII